MRLRCRTLNLVGRLGVCIVTVAAMVGLFAPGASAQITHKFLHNIQLSGGKGPLPLGVDPEGNIIVWFGSNSTVQKFSPEGNPVPFSALGTNVIDGKGGGNCPTTPSDCDEVPIGSFEAAVTPVPGYVANYRQAAADMDQTVGQPTSGYIYVDAINESDSDSGHEAFESRIFVFDSTGRYRGELDKTKPTPDATPEGFVTTVSVAPGGVIGLTYANQGGIGLTAGHHVDKYSPIDGNPAHDVFAGQLRLSWEYGGATLDDDIAYGASGSGWQGYTSEQFDLAKGPPKHLAFPVLWGNNGQDPEGGQYKYVSIDPATHDAYLSSGYSGYIAQWSRQNQEVGEPFGGPEVGAGGPLVFDTSETATKGRIYAGDGEASLAVFGPPVTVPDVDSIHAHETHTGAEVSADVDLLHGPGVIECRIQWEESPPPYYNPSSKKCEPATPYGENQHVTATIAGLTTGKLYQFRILTRTVNGTTKSQYQTFRPAAVLDLATQPATSVAKTTAQLHGELNGDGIETKYHFEYGISTNYTIDTQSATVPLPIGLGAVPPVNVSNLQAGRTYHFRLVAENELGTTFGGDETFIAAASPSLSGIHASEVAETSATLRALIEPAGYDTKYHFEFGPSVQYGSTVPAVEGEINGGHEPVAVEVPVTGLAPHVIYHFRLVASNEWGTSVSEDTTFSYFPESCPNNEARQIGRSGYLPDCRAYELVSPANVGAIQLLPGNILTDFKFYKIAPEVEGAEHLPIQDANTGGAASSPARFSYLGAVGAVNGTNPPNSLVDMYTATRTPTGWNTVYWGLKGNEGAWVGGSQCSLSMDVCLDYKVRDLLGATEEFGEPLPYVWRADGQSLGRWPTNAESVENSEESIGNSRPSPDFSHFVFSSRNVAFAEGGLTTGPGSVYDNDVGARTVTIVSKRPNGQKIPAGNGGASEAVAIPAVSTHGNRILMATRASGNGTHLYMREDDSTTYEIAGGASVNFIAMTLDGSKVVFSSKEKLTSDDTDASLDIFVWNAATDTITRVSGAGTTGNSNSCSASWTTKCSVVPMSPERPDSDDLIASEAGDVYFYSPEQLDESNPGIPNEKNLYVYRNGTVHFVATMDPNTEVNRVQISPDGEKVAFLTAARLTPYDNEGWKEVYTYTPETGVIRCASCSPDGQPPQIIRPPLDPFNEDYPFLTVPSADTMVSQDGRFMSNDGRVAFATSEPLVERDTDGVLDVYEYTGGHPQLISSGTSELDVIPGSVLIPPQNTGLEAVSADGTDIYFSTYDTLVPQDLNGQFLKFYDARSAGGFPAPPPGAPCAAADECHGTENPGPGTLNVGTEAALGIQGNLGGGAVAKPKTPHRRRPRHKQGDHRKHHHSVRRGRVDR